VIFDIAKRRCFRTIVPTKGKTVGSPPITDADDEDAWAALDELNNVVPASDKRKGKERAILRPAWLPETIQPILEEQPKWDLLSEILLEIESEMIRFQTNLKPGQMPGNDTVLIMTSSTRSCDLIQEFLDCIDPDARPGRKGTKMMQRRLKEYLSWRGRLGGQDFNKVSESNDTTQGYPSRVSNVKGKGEKGRDETSDVLRKKNREKVEKTAGRRRVRGGAPSSSTKRNAVDAGAGIDPTEAPANEKSDTDKIDEDMAL